MPRFGPPLATREIVPTTIERIDREIAIQLSFRKSMFVLWKRRTRFSDSDGQGFDALLRPVDQVEQEVRHEDRGEDRREEADDERDGEALDRARAELEEEERGRDRRDVGVDDRAPRALEAEVDRGLRGLAVVHLLAA